MNTQDIESHHIYKAVLSALMIALLCVSALLCSESFVMGRLQGALSSSAMTTFKSELQSKLSVLERIDVPASGCTPEVKDALKAVVDQTPFIYKIKATVEGQTPCTTTNDIRATAHGLTLAVGIYQVGLDPAAMRKALELPWWLSVVVEDEHGTGAPQLLIAGERALVDTYGQSQLFIVLNTNIVIVLAVGSLWLSFLLIITGSPKLVKLALNKSDTHLIKGLIDKNKINIQYQPIIDMNSQRWVGAEALLRCSDKLTDTYYPAPYIVDLAQKNGLSHQLIREICKKVALDFNYYLWALNDFYISINLTAYDLCDASLPQDLQEIFDEFSVPASAILFEITETTLVADEMSIENVFRLKKMGFKIALDDFATGYCGLQYLEKFPVDIIKLDASYVSAKNSRMVKYAAGLAKLKNVKVIAEGIETKDQVDELLSEGIRLGQGWYFCATLPPITLVREYFINDQKDSIFVKAL